MKHHSAWIWLGLILVVALGLRLQGLGGKGLAYFDEGQAHLESRFWASSISALAGEVFAGDNSSNQELEAKLYGSAMLHPKPLHAVLGIPFALVTSGSDLTLLLPMALLGALTIIPIYLLARRWGGNTAGLVAAGIWAVSPVALLYGREALAESDAAFFFAWAILWLLNSKEKQRSVFWAGLWAGAALACNYRWAIALAPFPFLLILEKPWSKSLVRIGIWVVGLLVIPLAVMGSYEGLIAWIKGHGVEPGGAGYWGALAFFGSEHSLQGFNLLGLFTFPYVLLRLEGVALLLTYGAGIWWGWQKGGEIRRFLIVGMFPVLFFTLQAFHMMRAFFPAWIFMTVLCGLFLHQVAQWLKRRVHPVFAYAILLLIPVASIPCVLPSLVVKSGIPEAQAWLNKEGGGQFHTQYFVAAVYSNPYLLYMPPANPDEFSEAQVKDIRFLVTDAQRGLWGYGDTFTRNLIVAGFERQHKPFRVFANPAGAHPQFMLEHNMALAATIEHLDDPANGEIRIYLLK